MLQVGDTVKLPQGYTGTLRWLGRIEGSLIEYAGVELDQQFAMHGKHSGVFNNKHYFKTQLENSGIFISFSKLISSNVYSPQYESDSTLPADSDLRSSSRLARRSTSIGAEARPLSRAGSDSDLTVALQQAEEEISRLRAVVLEKEGRITSLRETMDQRQQEFRETIDFFEEQSKTLDHDYSILVQQLGERNDPARQGVDPNSSTASFSRLSDDPVNQELLAELETQKAALASLQNKLLDEGVLLQEQLNAAETEIAALKAENQKLKESNPEINSENMELLLSELQRLELQVSSNEQKIVELEATITKLTHENDKLIAELKESKTKTEECRAEADSLKAKHQSQADLLAAAEKLAEERAEEISKLEGMVTQLSLNETLEYEHPEAVVSPQLVPGSLDQTRIPDLNPDLAPKHAPEPVTLAPAPVVDPFDPAAGRDNWCGLCERSGHTSVECPFDD